ncbi:MAG: CvpA family protein [Candidatus Marinimicrobia bacterium]|nr:CvpA family protein [Candidatus Neomarinimicrobiota bacterium]
MILFLDGLAVFVVLILAVIGYQRGFVEELGRLLGLVVAALVGIRFYWPVGQLIMARSEWDDQVVLVLSFFILFIVVLVLLRLVTSMIQIMLMSRNTRWADRLTGFIFGFCKGIFILILIVWITGLFPTRAWAQTVRSQSQLFPKLDYGGRFIVRLFHLEDNLDQGGQIFQHWVEKDTTRQADTLIETSEQVE